MGKRHILSVLDARQFILPYLALLSEILTLTLHSVDLTELDEELSFMFVSQLRFSLLWQIKECGGTKF